VLLFASNPIALLIAKLLNQNARLFVKNQNVTGNAINPNAPNLNVNWFVKIQTAVLKLNAALALLESPEYLNPSHSSKRPKVIKNAAHANIKMIGTNNKYNDEIKL
jgi:hypothetical protein